MIGGWPFVDPIVSQSDALTRRSQVKSCKLEQLIAPRLFPHCCIVELLYCWEREIALQTAINIQLLNH